MVIGSPSRTTQIFLSKEKTYEYFKNVIATPKVYNNSNDVAEYPVFLKPKIGYGSRGTRKANNKEQLEVHLAEWPDCIILEYLPGDEYTVDCFTNSKGKLLFCGPRIRKRISNGISVNTTTIVDNDIKEAISELAHQINNSMPINGAWFFQLKKDKNQNLTLMEVAARMGGSSGLFRAKGINFALMSVWNALGNEVNIICNSYETEMDRALTLKFKTNVFYDKVYVDLDDNLIINNEINTELIAFLYQAFNEKKRLILISRHKDKLPETLLKYRITNLFDEIIHLQNNENKAHHITAENSILIDDSFAERFSVNSTLGIPVFAPDAVESLMK
jgi:hypothetical protein